MCHRSFVGYQRTRRRSWGSPFGHWLVTVCVNPSCSYSLITVTQQIKFILRGKSSWSTLTNSKLTKRRFDCPPAVDTRWLDEVSHARYDEDILDIILIYMIKSDKICQSYIQKWLSNCYKLQSNERLKILHSLTDQRIWWNVFTAAAQRKVRGPTGY